jgi:hypothetical protein
MVISRTGRWKSSSGVKDRWIFDIFGFHGALVCQVEADFALWLLENQPLELTLEISVTERFAGILPSGGLGATCFVSAMRMMKIRNCRNVTLFQSFVNHLDRDTLRKR